METERIFPRPRGFLLLPGFTLPLCRARDESFPDAPCGCRRCLRFLRTPRLGGNQEAARATSRRRSWRACGPRRPRRAQGRGPRQACRRAQGGALKPFAAIAQKAFAALSQRLEFDEFE